MPRPRRICFVAYRGNMNCGGQGIYLWFLARELARMGIEVDVVVGPPYPDAMPFARSAVQLPNQELWAKFFTRDYAGMLPDSHPAHALLPLNLYELGASRLGFLSEPFAFSLRAFAALRRRLLAGERWDLIHDVQCLGYGIWGLHRLGLPVVSTIHHPLSVDRRASFIRDESFRDAIGTMMFYPIGMQSFVARRIDRIFTSSEESARTIVADFGVRPDRIRNVLNGLDTDLYSPDQGGRKNEDEILCVGRASDPNKGIRNLIQALANLPARLRLTLVDNDHPESEIFKWAQEAGVADRLQVTGRVEVDELVRLYRRAALAVVPSRYEGFGLPAVEAMACGTPVVACRAGALPELMELVGGGLLVEKDDPQALAVGILELMNAPARRRELGAKARELVDAHLSWRRVAAVTAEGYAEVLDERRGRPTSTMTSASVG
ncbi:MAG: glycosyltransferase family 4 protein [Deltaproteobacteria bacterium]|nr:glycosyltransferase family 4 protein [Deltaproteobacteria bacterium]MBW2384406.1 glycosyltransferase family 4 protein [Deltaproteobacteria bacterium]MBW2695306.1 glycosyltransferase family 4 protein [Deltaproteobacteria bacterium]